jgi:hypothetical protein
VHKLIQQTSQATDTSKLNVVLSSDQANILSFYLQNIRNNENKARTPKWARKAGLVDPADEQRRIAKSQWTKRYAERNNVSTHVGAELEEGESGGNYMPVDPREEERIARLRNEGLWRGEDESYYNEGEFLPYM